MRRKVLHPLLVVAVMAASCMADDEGTTGTIRKKVNAATAAVSGQFARVRSYVHEMGVEGRVYARLHWDKALEGTKLDVKVEGGVATLKGQVSSEDARRHAVELAEQTIGVKEVRDQLTVAKSS